MALQQPSEARKAYLNGLPKDEQADVMREAEERGIGPTDFVWLEMRAAQEAAQTISATSTEAAARIMAAAAQVDRGPAALGPDALAAIEAAVARAVKAPIAPAARAGSAPWWRDAATFAGGLLTAVVLALTIALLGPKVGPLNLALAGVVGLGLAGIVALWREAPKPPANRLPGRELLAFLGGILVAVALVWAVRLDHVLPLEARFVLVLAAGVAIGVFWRARR